MPFSQFAMKSRLALEIRSDYFFCDRNAREPWILLDEKLKYIF